MHSLSLIHKIANLAAKFSKMDRIFHARTSWYQFLLLILLGVNLFFFMWCKLILWALVMTFLLILVIEQITHTTYTVTADGRLDLYYGRFRRRCTVSLDEIRSVKSMHSFKVGERPLIHYLLIEYGTRQFVSLIPTDEEAFLQFLHKRMKQK